MTATSDGVDNLSELEGRIGYAFRARALLLQALTHRSYLHEHPDSATQTNERLEFLGDAVFHFVVAEELFRRFPDASEGRLTALRAALVCTSSLAGMAEELTLSRFLRVSRGEATIDGRGRQSILADALEAVIAAVYLDQGIVAARRVVRRLVRPRLAHVAAYGEASNVKGRLQELVQAAEGITPSYRVIDRSGPVHAERFVVEVVAGERVLGQGAGLGKRSAEQDAARAALAAYSHGGTSAPPSQSA